MSWIDITLQQVLSAKLLIKMAEVLHHEEDVEGLRHEVVYLTRYVNQNMWEPTTFFYYDRFSDGILSKVKSIASYWAMLADVIPMDKEQAFIAHLSSISEFDRKHRVASLSADTPEFDPGGGYWKGSVWAPTNYMVLRGLTQLGEDSLAYEIARNHLDNVVHVFSETGTLFENYAPDIIKGNDRKDFVGWTGIVPITVLFEYVFGLRPDVPQQRLVLDVRILDEYGVRNYPFGKNGTITVQVDKRKSLLDKPKVNITSTIPFTLDLRWAGGNQLLPIKPDIH